MTSHSPGLVYDIGMHRGEDTAYYLKRGLRVVGIEADPDHAAYCRAQFTDTLAQGQLVIVEGAIADTNEPQIKFYKNLENSVWGTVDTAWVARNERRRTHHQVFMVRVLDLRECFQTYGAPDFLKIDIEGADTAVLRALQRCDARPAYLSLESDMVSFVRLEGEIRLLCELGYNAFRAVQQGYREPRTVKLSNGTAHTFHYGDSGPLPDAGAGRWENTEQILQTYRAIFRQYRLFGTESWLWQQQWGEAMIRKIGVVRHVEFPGWYDTHARHSSVTPSQ